MGDGTVATALHRRLASVSLLDEEAAALLNDLLERRRRLQAGERLQEEGAPMERARVLLSGWGMRARSLPDGSRQVIGFLLPGDSVGLYGALFRESLTYTELLTDAEVAEFPCVELVELFARSPRLGAALCWIGGQDERFVAQQLVRVGRLAAPRRIGHLLLELLHRRRLAGSAEPEARVFPLTQQVIADALGMSHVHANRSCRELVRRDLLVVDPGRIELLDEAGLVAFAGFDADYIVGGGPSRAGRARIADA